MRYRKILFPIIFLCSLFLSCTTGFGMWLFNNNDTANLQYDPQEAPEDDKIQMDDIAENYYFAADLKSTNFYKVIFFLNQNLLTTVVRIIPLRWLTTKHKKVHFKMNHTDIGEVEH